MLRRLDPHLRNKELHILPVFFPVPSRHQLHCQQIHCGHCAIFKPGNVRKSSLSAAGSIKPFTLSLSQPFGSPVETIWKYTREGRIPYIKLGSKQYRYRPGEVVETLSGIAVREKESGYQSGSENKLTYRDYLELPEEPGYRFEILEGMLVKETSPSVMHQRVSRRLQQLLEDYFRQTDPRGEVFGAPLDTTFGEETVVQPDLLYVSAKQQELIKETRIDGPPRAGSRSDFTYQQPQGSGSENANLSESRSAALLAGGSRR